MVEMPLSYKLWMMSASQSSANTPSCGSSADHENTPQRYRVDMGFFHQRNILRENVWPVEPLLRVIVTAME